MLMHGQSDHPHTVQSKQQQKYPNENQTPPNKHNVSIAVTPSQLIVQRFLLTITVVNRFQKNEVFS